MDELCHGLWLFLVQLMNEKIGINAIVERRQQQLIIHFIHCQSFSVETSDKGPQTFIFSLFYDQQAGQGTFMPLSPNKVVNKQLA